MNIIKIFCFLGLITYSSSLVLKSASFKALKLNDAWTQTHRINSEIKMAFTDDDGDTIDNSGKEFDYLFHFNCFTKK